MIRAVCAVLDFVFIWFFLVFYHIIITVYSKHGQVIKSTNNIIREGL